ncbi:MAG: AMIN-like domain-containing (lipo)protein [Actinomycetes bacterium]
MRKVTVALLLGGLVLPGALLVSAASASTAPAAAAPSCRVTWGSLGKTAGSYTRGPVMGARAAQHACFDRFVVDLAGKATGYRVGYVTEVRQDGSGRPVPLRGAARLRLIVKAPAYDNSGNPTFPATNSELVDVSGFRTLRQIAGAGSFEGQTTIGLGVRARLPFRVFVLDGPGTGSRIVVDVAHRW